MQRSYLNITQLLLINKPSATHTHTQKATVKSKALPSFGKEIFFPKIPPSKKSRVNKEQLLFFRLIIFARIECLFLICLLAIIQSHVVQVITFICP